jgi:hypothetical protein
VLATRLPEVYRLHQRTVDVEGYVSVNSIRYSVPVSWIGRRVEVRETRDKVEIELDARHLVTHVRAVTPQTQRVTLAEHRPPRGEGVKRSDPHPGRDTAGSCAASRDTTANHRRSHPPAGYPVPVAARCGKETRPQSGVGPRTRYAS